MIRPRGSSLPERVLPLLAFVFGLFGPHALAQEFSATPRTSPGQFFKITEPITHETIARIRAATRQLVDASAAAEEGSRPILVFEFLPGDTAPGSSEFGACYDLAKLISQELAGAKLTVAYVPQPLKGYAVLPAVACTEIVMGSSASPGPDHARRRRRSMPPCASRCGSWPCARRATPTCSWECSTAMPTCGWSARPTSRLHYVLAENLTASGKLTTSIDEQPAWEGGQRGVLTGASGHAKKASASAPPKAPTSWRALYQTRRPVGHRRPHPGPDIRPAWIKLEGLLDNVDGLVPDPQASNRLARRKRTC